MILHRLSGPPLGSFTSTTSDDVRSTRLANRWIAKSSLRTTCSRSAAGIGRFVRVGGTWANSVYFHDANDELPELRARNADAGRMELPPASITFLAMPGAQDPDCRCSSSFGRRASL
jgi:hypothetical protein